MVTPANSLEKERRTGGSWRGAGPEQGQPGDGGQLDHAAVGLHEGDAEQVRAAAAHRPAARARSQAAVGNVIRDDGCGRWPRGRWGSLVYERDWRGCRSGEAS